MTRSTRPRRHLLRTTAAAVAIAAASLTSAACGSDVVNDDVEQNIEEGVDDAEREVEEGTDGEDDEG